MNLYHLSQETLTRYATLEIRRSDGLSLTEEETNFVNTIARYIDTHAWPDETPADYAARQARVAHFRNVIANLPS